MNIYQFVYYNDGIKNDMSELDEKFINDIFINDLTFLYKYDGNVCSWENFEIGDNILITIITDSENISKIESLDFKYNGFVDKFIDITKDVLYDIYDTKIFGFAEEKMIIEFQKYRNIYLDKDIVLDKINELGIESLTENDRLLLSDKKMNFCFYN